MREPSPPADWPADAASVVTSTRAGDRVTALTAYIGGCVRATRLRLLAPRGESWITLATWPAGETAPVHKAHDALRRRAADEDTIVRSDAGRVLSDAADAADAASLLILPVASSGAQRVLLELEGEPLHLPPGADRALQTLCAFLALSLDAADRQPAAALVAGGIAHDLNNHLTAINGLCDVILDDPELAAGVREDLTYVHAAGERAALLTQQLLAFSGRQLLDRRVVDVASCLEQALPSVRRVLDERVRVEMISSGVPAPVDVDPQQLTNVLLMLAANAQEAGASTIRVEAAVLAVPGVSVGDPGLVRLTVSDNGRGMSPELQGRAFAPFFTTKRQLGHVGLGLCAAAGLLRQHDATIDLTSSEGAGTTVEIRLPLTAGR